MARPYLRSYGEPSVAGPSTPTLPLPLAAAAPGAGPGAQAATRAGGAPHVFELTSVCTPHELYREITGHAVPRDVEASAADGAGGVEAASDAAGPSEAWAGAEVGDDEGAGSGRARKKRKVDRKAKKSEIWFPRAELAFCYCIAYIPPNGRTKIRFMGKPLGRNELIAAVCTLATGRRYNRKQISSHSQVLKDKVKSPFKELLTFDDKARLADDDVNQSSTIECYLLPEGLCRLIGYPAGADLASAQAPQWLLDLEGGGDMRASAPRHEYSFEQHLSNRPTPAFGTQGQPPPHQYPVPPPAYPPQPPLHTYPAIGGSVRPSAPAGPSLWSTPSTPHDTPRHSVGSIGASVFGTHHRTSIESAASSVPSQPDWTLLPRPSTSHGTGAPKIEPDYALPAAPYAAWDGTQFAYGKGDDWQANKSGVAPLALGSGSYGSTGWAGFGDDAAQRGSPRRLPDAKASPPYLAQPWPSSSRLYTPSLFVPLSLELVGRVPAPAASAADRSKTQTWIVASAQPLTQGAPMALHQIGMWEARYPFLRDMLGADVPAFHVEVPLTLPARALDRATVLNSTTEPLRTHVMFRSLFPAGLPGAGGVGGAGGAGGDPRAALPPPPLGYSLVTDSGFVNYKEPARWARERAPLKRMYGVGEQQPVSVSAQTALPDLTCLWRHMANGDRDRALAGPGSADAPAPFSFAGVTVPNCAVVQMVVPDAAADEYDAAMASAAAAANAAARMAGGGGSGSGGRATPPQPPVGTGWRRAAVVLLYSFYVPHDGAACAPVLRAVDFGAPSVSRTSPSVTEASYASELLISQLDANEQQQPSDMQWALPLRRV